MRCRRPCRGRLWQGELGHPKVVGQLLATRLGQFHRRALELSKSCPHVVRKCWRYWAKIRPASAEYWHHLGQPWRIWAEFGQQHSTRFDQTWSKEAKLDRCLVTLANMWSNLGQTLPMSANMWPLFGHSSANVGRSWPTVDHSWLFWVNLRPKLAEIGPHVSSGSDVPNISGARWGSPG